MGGTTNSQALRYPYLNETITDASTKNLADDCAAQLLVQDGRRTAAIRKPIAWILRNANQSFADGVDTLVQFDTEIQDSDNLVNLGVNNTRITVPSTLLGIWYVTVSVTNTGFTGSVTKGQLSILVTGAVASRRTVFTATGTVKDTIRMSAFVNVGTANDYIETSLLHTGGGALNASSITMKAIRRTS